MHIVGTAGHVDHGKSSLVLALTGTNPDRWAEERLRGMTLDLGFAHLHFPDGLEAGIVDVPGHERFLHNMLAGAAGMEVLLLVVAADDGVRPQTLEHLAILDFLNVGATLVVLTKTDLVDAARLGAVSAEIRAACAGTVAAGAPLLPVSTVTGAGLDELRRAIHGALLALPPRAPDAPAFLPVDRVFALAGHGTILTGSLLQGSLRVGDELQLTPPGRRVRIRSLQTFGAAQERVFGGARVAVNVPGIETREVARGAVLASAQFAPAASLHVRFRAVAEALDRLRRRTPVRAYIGSAEILGTLVFDEVPASADPCSARLHLRESAVTYPGEAFVVRAPSPKRLLGGGTIALAASSLPAGDDGIAVDETPEFAGVASALRDAGRAGSDAERAGATANVRSDAAAAILDRLVAEGRAFRITRPAGYVDAEAALELAARVVNVLADAQTAVPWTFGMTSLALARALDIPEAALARLLALFVDEGRIAMRSGYYSTPDFSPRLTDEQRAFFDLALRAKPEADLVPVDFATIVADLKASKIAGLAAAFETLLASREAIKIGEALYRREQIERARAAVESTLRAEKTMTRFRDLVGTTRKYAVPLLEWFDASGVTLRSGDVRVLRERREPIS